MCWTVTLGPGITDVEGYGPFEMLADRQMIAPQVAPIAARQATPAILAQLADVLATMRAENSQGGARPISATTGSM